MIRHWTLGEFLDLGAPASNLVRGCRAPVPELPVWGGRAADLRFLLERVCRLVSRDRQAPAGGRGRPGILHRHDPGQGTRYLPAPAAPFTPFVTEELWGHLKQAAQEHRRWLGPEAGWPEALIIAPWPEPREEEGWETGRVEDFNLVQEIVRSIRNLRAEKNVPPGKRIPAIIAAGSQAALLEDQRDSLASLAQLDSGQVHIHAVIDTKPAGHIALVVGQVEVYLPLAGMVDLGAERSRLEKELADVSTQIERLQSLLASPFADKAPGNVVQKERDKLAGYQETAAKLTDQLIGLRKT